MWCRNTWLLVKIYEVSCVRWQISTRAWLPLNFEEHLLSMCLKCHWIFQRPHHIEKYLSFGHFDAFICDWILGPATFCSFKIFPKALMNYQRTMQVFFKKNHYTCPYIGTKLRCAGLRARPRSVAASLTTGKAPTGSKLFLTGSARSSPTPSR
ncbi:hypothetical protein PAHAL_4G115400 [Panicum hallii]|jgi:hypothetical protein|uniref:Uncharacterized protein n=1 Tax=Panicum hallii TaxID=206008 RepID=A0A2T8JCN5_9POAL|nr:hypothetical protein PAHAL_4G115400 [Panicum hallii]